MAAKKQTRKAPAKRRNYRTKAKESVDSQGLMYGGLGGVAANMAARYMGGTFGAPLGLAAAGAFAPPEQKTVLHTMAGVQLGAALANQVTLPGQTAPQNTGGWL